MFRTCKFPNGLPNLLGILGSTIASLHGPLELGRVTCICIPGEPVADPFWRVAREGILEPWFRIWRPSRGDAVVTITVMAHTIASKIT